MNLFKWLTNTFLFNPESIQAEIQKNTHKNILMRFVLMNKNLKETFLFNILILVKSKTGKKYKISFLN